MVDAIILIEQGQQFLNLPNMIGQPRLRRGRDPERLVNPAVVVVHEMRRDVVGMIQVETSAVFGGIVPHSGHLSGVARRS
jgi:hypothetical protein